MYQFREKCKLKSSTFCKGDADFLVKYQKEFPYLAVCSRCNEHMNYIDKVELSHKFIKEG